MRNTLILISILLNITCIWAQTPSVSSQGTDANELYRVVPFSESTRTEYDTNSVRTIIDAIDRYLADVSAIIAIVDTFTVKIDTVIVDNHSENSDNAFSKSQVITNTDETIYDSVDKMPEFPGGKSALNEYLSKNVKYPLEAKERGAQGRVICEFVVNIDGSISDVIVVRSGGDSLLDKEAIRVVTSMPKWNPGFKKGLPVRVRCTVPVEFRPN